MCWHLDWFAEETEQFNWLAKHFLKLVIPFFSSGLFFICNGFVTVSGVSSFSTALFWLLLPLSQASSARRWSESPITPMNNDINHLHGSFETVSSETNHLQQTQYFHISSNVGMSLFEWFFYFKSNKYFMSTK